MPSFYTEWFGTQAQGASRKTPTDAATIQRLIEDEARRQGVNPAIVVGIAKQESWLNPNAVGDNGKSLGLFQLQRAAAIDAGIDPERRGDLQENIRGGVAYFKQKLQQSGGNVEQALSRYNRGTPTYKGIGDPNYVENVLAKVDPGAPRQGLLQRVGRALSPASAEAAPVSPARQAAPPPATSYFNEFFGPAPGVGPAAPSAPAAPAPVAPSQPAVDTSGTAPWGPGASTTLPAPGPPAAPGAVLPWDPEASTTLPATPPGRPAGPEDVTLLGQPPPAAPPPPVSLVPPPTPGGLVAPYGTAPVAPPVPAFAQPGATPLPRSPALAAQQQQEAQVPWWQRVGQSGVGSSPEIARLQQQHMQVEQARAEMTPAERQELLRREGQSGTGADIGEMTGQMIGSAIMPGPGTAIGGTIGAVTGMTAETLAREGRLPTWKEVGTEALWSAVPEVLESSVRGIGRGIARQTQGGRLIRLDEATRRARALPQVFEAQTRQEVGAQFDAVRASGLQLDVTPLRQEVQRLTPGVYDDVRSAVRQLDNTNMTGGRYQRILDALRTPGRTPLAAVPIGDLQDFRSVLRGRVEALHDVPEARQRLQDLQDAVDGSIDAGLARGRVATGMTVEQLQEARRQWARVRSAEDLQTMVERSVDVTPDLTMNPFNLKKMANALRRNEGPLAQRVNRSLDHTPGARAAFQREMEEVAGLYETVELPMADVFGIWRAPGFAMARQWISAALSSRQGREIFRQSVIEGRGVLSLNGLALAANAARREQGLPEFPELVDILTKGTSLPDQPQESGGLQPGRQIQVEPGRVSR